MEPLPTQVQAWPQNGLQVKSIKTARAEPPQAVLRDETAEVFFGCTGCQTYFPNQVCIITPERPGPCGRRTWTDCRQAGRVGDLPFRPLLPGAPLDVRCGRWVGVETFAQKASAGAVQRLHLYALLGSPPPWCGWPECISVVLPGVGGVMIVDRDFAGPTPCGLSYGELTALCGRGVPVPGVLGQAIDFIASRKFLRAEGGWRRVVWMTRRLKQELARRFGTRPAIACLLRMAADEGSAATEDQIQTLLLARRHPVLTMAPLL